MKRLMLVLLVLALCGMMVFVSCRRAVDPDGVINITMAIAGNPQENLTIAFFHFAERVEELSGGRMRVHVAHSSVLGGQRDYMEQMQMGSLEGAEIVVSVLSAFDPSFMVFDLPYVSTSVPAMQELLEGPMGQKFSDSLEARTGVKILGWMVRSPRNMYIASRPIHRVEDFAGMRVRIMESPVMHRTFTLLGAVPVPISASERYMALQTGVVDAAENAVSLILTEREYEVTRYVSLTEHMLSPCVIAFSARFFHSLPPDLQQVLLQAGFEAGRFATRLDMEGEAETLRELERRGMIVNEIPDKTPFVERTRPIFDEFRDRIGADLMDEFLRHL